MGQDRGDVLFREANVSNSSGVSSSHRYFFINDILCRTETSVASFRPSDVFMGLDPPPVRTSILGDASPNHTNNTTTTTTTTAATAPAGVDRDCPIFNTFGVLSGGVLVDPIARNFVDFVDNIVFPPTLSREENDNDVHYRSLEYSKIQAEGVVVLCSSIEPFNAPGTERTPLSWPRSRLMSSADAAGLARRNIRHILSHSVYEMSMKEEELFLVEFFRCHMKCVRPQMTFMTESIPFITQYGGRRFPSEEEDTTPAPTNNSGTIYSATAEGSPYSEFHCFTGLPKMAYRKYEEKSSRGLGRNYAQRLELRLQQLMRPFRNKLCLASRPQRVRLATEHKRSWWMFLRYFEFLRVYPLPTPDANGRTIWRFSVNADNAGDNPRNHNDSNLTQMDSLRNFEAARLSGRTAKVNMHAVADAWDWLLRNDRDRLMRHIWRLQRVLKKLEAERSSDN